MEGRDGYTILYLPSAECSPTDAQGHDTTETPDGKLAKISRHALCWEFVGASVLA